MNPKPGTISIMLNDTWAAPAIGALVMLIVMTTITLGANQLMGKAEPVDATAFIWMTGIACPAVILTVILRIRYVTQVFENGILVKAQVLESIHYKSNLRLKLRYTCFGQTREKKFDQVITGKTKKLLSQTEVTLVIDKENPDRLLLRDAYF